MLAEDFPDGGGGDLDTQGCEFAVADQQQKVPQSIFWEVVEHAGEDDAVHIDKGRLPGPALQDQQLVPEYEDLDVLLTHRQEA